MGKIPTVCVVVTANRASVLACQRQTFLLAHEGRLSLSGDEQGETSAFRRVHQSREDTNNTVNYCGHCCQEMMLQKQRLTHLRMVENVHVFFSRLIPRFQ